MNDNEKLVFRDLLQKTKLCNRSPTKGRMSGRDRYVRNNLDDVVGRVLNLDNKLKGGGIEKFIIPINIIDIYTRLESCLA